MFQKYENKVEDIIKAQNGDTQALESLIKQNQGLLWSIVKRFTGRGFETEDLYQIASLGFIKSIKKFDTDFDVRLSTYAVPYILGEIKRYIQEDGPIKVSRALKELNSKLGEECQYFNDTINYLIEKYGDENRSLCYKFIKNVEYEEYI